MTAPQRWIIGAWAMYGVAWVVPVHVHGVTLPQGLPGWQAFRLAATPVWPYRGTPTFDSWYDAVLPVLSAATNFVVLGSIAPVLRRSRSGLLVLAWTAVAAFVVNSQWWARDIDHVSDLRGGYFLWWAAFLPLAIGAHRMRTQGAR